MRARIWLRMAFRSVVKSKRHFLVSKSVEDPPGDLQPGRSSLPPDLLGLFSTNQEAVPPRPPIEESHSEVPSVPGEKWDFLDGRRASTQKGSSMHSLETTTSTYVDDGPPAGCRTYKWAEARLSESAALAGANWDHPEIYMDYIRRKRQSGSQPARKRSMMPVARPVLLSSDVAVPQEMPPSLEQSNPSQEKAQIVNIQQTQKTTADSRPHSAQMLPTEEHLPSHLAVTTVAAAPIHSKACIDDSPPGPSKPTPAWEAPVDNSEKAQTKCNCVLM